MGPRGGVGGVDRSSSCGRSTHTRGWSEEVGGRTRYVHWWYAGGRGHSSRKFRRCRVDHHPCHSSTRHPRLSHCRTTGRGALDHNGEWTVPIHHREPPCLGFRTRTAPSCPTPGRTRRHTGRVRRLHPSSGSTEGASGFVGRRGVLVHTGHLVHRVSPDPVRTST